MVGSEKHAKSMQTAYYLLLLVLMTRVHYLVHHTYNSSTTINIDTGNYRQSL